MRGLVFFMALLNVACVAMSIYTEHWWLIPLNVYAAIICFNSALED